VRPQMEMKTTAFVLIAKSIAVFMMMITNQIFNAVTIVTCQTLALIFASVQ
jgi:hypothetical protein